MTISSQNITLLAGLSISLLVMALLLKLLLRWPGLELRTTLTSQEARTAFQLVGIVLMVLLLILAQNALALPEKIFIYGRF